MLVRLYPTNRPQGLLKGCKMDKIDFYIHHQVIWDCPSCNETNIEDSGEMSAIEGEEVTCHCGKKFELGEQQ